MIEDSNVDGTYAPTLAEIEASKKPREWIGVDLDGTLAHYDGWKGPTHIGAPVPAMVDRVKRWLEEGRDVRIFTARVGGTIDDEERAATFYAIIGWCKEHLGQVLGITCVKDFGMIELWDDRAVQVEPNTGRPIGRSTRGLDDPAPYCRADRLRTLDQTDCSGVPCYWEVGRWAATQAEADAEVADFTKRCPPPSSMGNPLWRWDAGLQYGQPRTCSHCGGIHPDDAIALVKAGWIVDATTKAYKRYFEPPGRAGSPLPCVKLYTNHFTSAHVDAFNAALRARTTSSIQGEVLPS